MKQIQFTKDANSVQLLEELGVAGISIESVTTDKNNSLLIKLNDEAKEIQLRNLVMSHTKRPILTEAQKIDKIVTIKDVKKFLKGEI